MVTRFSIALLMILSSIIACSQEIYQVTKGNISFESNAELEVIKASSSHLKGLFDLESNSFAFSIEINSFQGFNSALQQEHFNENYMESNRFPKADFKGKILDKIDKEKAVQVIRAKGKLKIHGIEKERILSITLKKQNDKFIISSAFNVPLEDHGIEIPRIVYQKIAESIQVSINAECARK